MRILTLHGFTGVGSDFAPLAELCTGSWHYPNLPGHGPNPSLDCSPEATVRFVEAERTNFNVQHSTPKILLGYSMGARAALHHVIENPDHWDALILISPNPGIENEDERAERRAVDEKLAQRIENEGTDAFIEFWQNTPMIRSQKNIRPGWREVMQANRKLHTPEGLATSLRQFGQGNCPNLWPELSKLKLPILLVTGSEDLKYTAIAERMANELSTFHAQPTTHAIIDGVSHMPHLEDPAKTVEFVEEFIRRS